MIRLNVLVEGDTERYFFQKLITPYLSSKNIISSVRSVEGTTVNGYEKIKKDICNWLKYDKKAYLTTMLDFYRLPQNFPELKNPSPTKKIIQKINDLEEVFKKDIAHQRFIPYLQLHEFEALLFSDIDILHARLAPDNLKCKKELEKIISSVTSPEFINDSPDTAPSKRLLKLNPAYRKIADSIYITEKIGLQNIRQKCTHFNQWLQKLELLSHENHLPQ